MPQCYIIHTLPVLFFFLGGGVVCVCVCVCVCGATFTLQDQFNTILIPLKILSNWHFVCIQLHLRLQDPCVVVWFKKIFEFQMFFAPCLWMKYIFWSIQTTGQNCLWLSSGFRNISRCTGVFGQRLSPFASYESCLFVWYYCLLGRFWVYILPWWLVFFEWVLCGFSLAWPGKCQNCISNWAITASFHILGVSADHKEKGSDTFPGTSLWFFPPVFKHKILYSRL